MKQRATPKLLVIQILIRLALIFAAIQLLGWVFAFGFYLVAYFAGWWPESW